MRANPSGDTVSRVTNIPRGAFILFEGGDRCGKTTQSKMMTERLNSLAPNSAAWLKFPDRTTEIGKMINSYLTNSSVKMDDRCLHLLFSANRWELVDTINELINRGVTIVVDRYAYSGAAYS